MEAVVGSGSALAARITRLCCYNAMACCGIQWNVLGLSALLTWMRDVIFSARNIAQTFCEVVGSVVASMACRIRWKKRARCTPGSRMPTPTTTKYPTPWIPKTFANYANSEGNGPQRSQERGHPEQPQPQQQHCTPEICWGYSVRT